METAHRFEDLVAWQFCTEWCEVVFRLTESGECLEDPEFRDQIRRAAENAPALIAEGFVRYAARNENFVLVAASRITD